MTLQKVFCVRFSLNEVDAENFEKGEIAGGLYNNLREQKQPDNIPKTNAL